MSDELKIELQVETDASKAKSQLNDLIDEYKKKKPINLDVKINDSNLDGFRKSIKTITDDLSGLANIKFDNLNKVESSLKKIANLINNVQNSNKNTSTTTKSTQGTFVEAFGFVDDIDFERLSRNHSEALKQVKNLQQSAAYLKDGFKAYSDKVKEAHKAFEVDNSELLSKIDELENMYDSRTFKKLITARKQLNEVFKEYNSLGVKLEKDEHPFEAYNGDTWVNSNDKYIDQIGMSVDRYRQQVARAKQLTQEKNALLKKIKGYLYTNARDRVTEDEKLIYDLLSVNYDKIPDVNLSDANQIRDTLTKILQDDFFKLDLSNLDLQFEEDFEKAYNKVFEVLEEVQKEYNSKFKNIDGFKELDIFDVDSLSKQNEKLEKEVENTTNVLKTLSQIESGSLEKLGLDDNSFNIMKTLSNSADELEGKLVSLKEKFSNAFEISADSAKALERVREALLEINKLTDEQKQVFFDFGLDVENIKKAKDETKELKEATDNISNVSFDGLIESYSVLQSATGQILSETEKLRTSAMSTVTLNYKYEEDELTGENVKTLSTAKYSEEISKRSKELLKEYKSASNDLIKAQKEYYKALTDGKSSEDTIDNLTQNVKEMETKLSGIRSLINELESYPDVMDDVFEKFNEIDKLRHSQMETDALKIVDSADLAEANDLLKKTKSLIDQISKNSVQLQKDMNAGYDETVEGLEARIKQQEKQVTSNISKLMNISNSKAAIDQIFSYQLDKAQQTQIEIARINDKANKNTGVKTVDEQDKFLKQYKDTLTQIKAITKSLAKESNGVVRAEKIFQLDKATTQLEEIKNKLNDVKKEAAEGLYDKAMRELDLSLSNSFSKTIKELDKVEEKITKLGKSDYVDVDRIKTAESVIAGLRNTLSKGLDNLDAKDLSKVLNTIEELKTAAKDIDLDIKLSKDSEKIETFIKGVREQLEVLQSMADNVDISHITKQFKDLEAGSDRNSVVMKSITDDVKTLEKSLKNAGNTASHVGLNFRGFFDDLGDSLRTFTLGEIIGDVITDAVSQTWDIVKEMDAAMANLKKVADASDVNTSDKLDNIRSQAIDVAKEVGMASSDVINAIADTLQAGVGGMEESIQVARSAMILANVGDMTQEAASSALNTIINGYKLDPLKQIDVQVGGLTQKTTELANAMDLLNYAGNNYAIGADGVAEAMQRGGTVLSEYGVSMQDAVGLITAANESIQDPAKVGNAMKSLAINMSGLKANASKGTMELNKTAKALKEIAGIDVYSDKSKGQVKDMVQILDELNVKLKEGKINQDEYRALSEAMAGKEQAAVFQALMSNYDTFKQIQGEFKEGLHFGSAEKENAAYVDSLEGKLNKLKEVWIDTLMVLADSDSLKGLLDVFISISEGINEFIKAIDGIGVTFPVLLGLISGTSSGFKAFSAGLDVATEGGKGLKLSLDGVKGVLSGTLVPAIKSFVTQGLLVAGVTGAVQLCAWGWDKLTSSVQDAADKLQTVEDEQLSNISAQNQKIKSLQTIGVEYENLASKANRTAEEESRMVELSNELAQILPEMVVGYDEDNNAILHMTDDMDGLISKTKEAKEQYEKLLLGTRIEQSDNALKMLTKGEIFGENSDGYIDQKTKVEEDYYKRMSDLQRAYNIELQNAASFEGKTRENALKRMQEIRNQMITEESKYQTKYSEIQSNIIEQSNIFRDEMDSTWRNSATLLSKEITPELEKSIESFVNALDFSEISSEQELESVRRVFRELPDLAQSGAVDVGKLTKEISDINKKFSETGNLEDYNSNMKELAKSVSKETGWDTDVLYEMFTQISDGTLKSVAGLENFLNAFGKTKKQLESGDSIAEVLHTQFNEMERVIQSISTHDFGDAQANLDFRVNLQNNQDLPKQIREMVNTLTKAGVDDKYIISLTGELMMSLKDGKLDETEIEDFKRKAREQLEGKMSKQKVEMTINGMLKSFNSEQMIKDIEGELGNKKVTKEVTLKADDPKVIQAIDEAIKILDGRPDVNKAVRAVVEGEEDLVIFGEIIKNLPLDEEHTNRFIVDNAQALSQLKDYQEVLDYINGLPKEVKATYGISEKGVSETSKKVEEINSTIDTVNGKELKVEASNDDVLKTIEDVESLIKISAEVEKGKYKIEIDANTQAAIDNINSLKDSVNNLNKELGSGKTVSYKAETAGAAKNISGLITRVNQIKKLTGKTFKYYSDTAGAAKNISGLITRVNQIKKLNGKTFKYYADTAQAAKNISGLITRIDQVNSRKGKTFTWTANTATAAKNISSLINRIDQINGRRSKTFSYTVKTKEVKQSLEDDVPAMPDVAPASMVSPISTVADEIATQTSNIQASLRTGVGEINSFSSNMARATKSTPLAINTTNINNSIKYSVELLQELENRIDKVNDQISLLDTQMENAVGTKKIGYLQQQNSLYKEQITLQKELQTNLKKEQAAYKSYLQGKGFKFNADGNLTNYEEKLLAMEKELARLEAAADKASDKYNNYTGDNEKTKNSLKSTYDAAKKKADNYADSLSEIKKFLDAYLDVTFDELPKATEEWQKLENAIAENNREIENLNRANKLYKFNNAIKETESYIESISDKLKILSTRMELEGTNTSNLREYISLLQQEIDLQESLMNSYANSMSVYQSDLSKYGFKFKSNGQVSNLDDTLNKYQNSSELEHITSILDEYLSLVNDKFPDAQQAVLDLTLSLIEQERVYQDLARNNALSKYTNNLKKAAMQSEALSDELDILSKKMELNGTSASSLKEYISLLEKQKKIQAGMISDYEKSLKVYQKDLEIYGFTFNDDGTIKNLDNVLNGYQNTGELEYITGIVDEYLNIVNNDLPEAEKNILDINISIKEQEKALKELARAEKFEKFTNKILELNNALESTSNELDMISSKLEYSYGKDKLNLLDQQIEKYREQQKIQEELIKQYKAEMKVRQSELFDLGFNFNADGSVSNMNQVLSGLTGEELEEVKSLLEEYLDIQNGSLPDAEKAWQDLDNAIKDTLKDQLNTTKDIEKKITDIYKKQIEERIEALNKETDAKLEALKKQQDAYNKYREEVDYQEEYDEKLAEVLEIQKQLDIAMKDSSLNGQKKVQELQKELAAAQKELQELTQDKIDQNVNDMFDKEAERLEKENEKAIEDLENKWSDSKIAEMVAQALGSGVFTDIEGNVHSLEDVLIDFAEESGELFGVLGSIIESELITNLGIARDTVKDLSNIMREFDLVGYTSTQNSRSIQGVTHSITGSGAYAVTNNNNINITSPIINIEGNVDANVVEELKQISEKIKTDVIDTIAKSIR